ETAENVKANAPEHGEWIDYLVQKYGTAQNKAAADEIVRTEIGYKFETCLEHAGVFKQTQSGTEAFTRFMNTLGARQI
ncbi:MAG: galactose-1-phosphate uridylyltransferase, partial [Oscillospiraceae bacterium]